MKIFFGLGEYDSFVRVSEEFGANFNAKYDTFTFLSKKLLNKINNIESCKYDTLLCLYNRVKDDLGIKNNDALWQVLIALQFYQTQHEKMPAEIVRAAEHG